MTKAITAKAAAYEKEYSDVSLSHMALCFIKLYYINALPILICLI